MAKKAKRLQSKYRLIAIDPGKKWCVVISKKHYPAPVNGPKEVIFLSGTEKEYTVGCKEMIVAINNALGKLSPGLARDETLLIMIEEPIGTMIRSIKSIMAQVGSVYYAFDSNHCHDPEDDSNFDQVIQCRPSDWKVFMRESGLVAGLSGNVGYKDKVTVDQDTQEKRTKFGYLNLIRKRFKRPTWTPDQASAFSMLQLMYSKADALIKSVEISRAKKTKKQARAKKKGAD